MAVSAFETGSYPDYFHLIGKSEAETQQRITELAQNFFSGPDSFYHETADGMAYLEDTGNHDVRTEGMSYGMMIAVQLDMKERFDRLWKWVCTYMWMDEGENEGYFAWSCGVNGEKNAQGPAPDGEEFFAMSLFFASHRWGEGEGICAYAKHARAILHACIRKGQDGRPGKPMWNRENYQILFVPGIDFTDASYHLPHFYELFALWAEEEDRAFYRKAAEASRQYLLAACHPETGMSPEYGEFDGSPMRRPLPWTADRHDWFFSDSYRTVANIGLDLLWFGKSMGQEQAPQRLLLFLDRQEKPFAIYETDGTPLGREALHPVGMLAGSVQGILAFADRSADAKTCELVARWLNKLWNTPPRSGERRYYDNCLHLFAFLALGGRYRIWK